MTDHTCTVQVISARSAVRGLDKYGGTTTIREGYVSQYLITCPACNVSVIFGGTREGVQLLCDEHEHEHHPERRTAATPPRPDHELIRTRPLPGGQIRLDCRCGLGWSGPDTATRATMDEHVAQYGPITPKVAATGTEAPRRLR